MKKEIEYIIGDATEPIGEGKKIIVHICNDIGAWGKGFVLALSRKWKEPEQEYRTLARNQNHKLKLGLIQSVEVTKDITVINMVAQHNIYPIQDSNGVIVQPIRYEALRECLEQVMYQAKLNDASVHMPMIGAGLAGGDWNIIEQIINETLIAYDVNTTVYQLK